MDPLLQLAPTAATWNEREKVVPSVRVLGFALTARAAGCCGRLVSAR